MGIDRAIRIELAAQGSALVVVDLPASRAGGEETVRLITEPLLRATSSW
jgi:hypothetical protein